MFSKYEFFAFWTSLQIGPFVDITHTDIQVRIYSPFLHFLLVEDLYQLYLLLISEWEVGDDL